MRVPHQLQRVQLAVDVLVDGDAAADHEAVVDLGDLAVVARPHQVQVAVPVQVRQGDRVQYVPGAEPLRPRVGARTGGGRAEPQARRIAGMGEDQVQPPVTVEIDDVDRARVVGRQLLPREREPAAVPQDAAQSVQVGQHDVDVAVVVQVVDAERRAHAGEDRLALRREHRGVGQRMGNECPAALRPRRDRLRPVGNLRLCWRQGGAHGTDKQRQPENSRPDHEGR